MSKIFASITLAALAASFSCCPPQDPTKLVARLQGETVELVDEDGDMYCAGVWIGPSEILTAAHCVDDVGLSMPEKTVRMLMQEAGDEPPAYNPVGASTFWKVQSDSKGISTRSAVVVKFDSSVELAHLHVLAPSPHAVVGFREASVIAGEEIHVVGHPINKPWSYSHGYVSNPSVEVGTMGGRWLQLDANVNSGDSGGGVFDDRGRLVSIVVATNRAGLAWCVSQGTMRTFLSQ